ncbi:MAG: protein kinase [Gemmatimonadales bacterium]|nr:protein kinase [Gemmatimonadales bacterium]
MRQSRERCVHHSPRVIETLARPRRSAIPTRRQVIHRDIKPENILLHDGRALVADFGIALAASKASGRRMTETGMSLGTPHYMSPEQAMGEREITARSDVYALGAMLYEMLTGDPPFTGSTAQAYPGGGPFALSASGRTEARWTVTSWCSSDPEPPGSIRAL